MLKQTNDETGHSNREPAAFGRLCVETHSQELFERVLQPAAFGRLCVETGQHLARLTDRYQPPSGGCVLKLPCTTTENNGTDQPPSGGCVLKQRFFAIGGAASPPAAFGRLCVETELENQNQAWRDWPAAFGRLCVETSAVYWIRKHIMHQPPSGGCVLKLIQCRLQLIFD